MMIKNGKILVPTDFSNHSDEALRRAVALADAFGAKVYLLHILSPTPYFTTDDLSIQQFPEIDKARHKNSLRMLERQSSRQHNDIQVHLEESPGDTAQVICDFAKDLGADLIVTGRHNQQTAMEHLFIGSVAERVVRFAHCTVLVAVPHTA